jgi:hypothetical protein
MRILLLRHQRPDADDLGMSRDDAGRFLTQYVDKGIFERDPFVSNRY